MASSQNLARSGGEPFTALTVLDYMHAPAVGFYYLGALTFGICTLQTAKSSASSAKRRRVSQSLIIVMIISYVAQALYYFGRVLADEHWSAAQHAVIHALSSIMVWTALDLALFRSKAPLWHPFLGCFLLGVIFETTICGLTAKTLLPQDRLNSIPLSLNSLRVAVSWALLVDGLLISFRSQVEKNTDEEVQSLLPKPVNGFPELNRTVQYGAIDQDAVQDNNISNDDDEPEDRDKEIKEQQRKRLEEQGGWIGYLRGFTVFLPYLWPRDNWKIQFCLVIRGLYVLQGRVLHLLVPRQIGIITDQLASGRTSMPWKEILLWTLYSWLNSFAGFGFINNLASTFINNYSRKRLSDLAFSHVMSLSMDFHSNKDSGEVLRSVEQAESLNDLIELFLFDIGPVLLDLVVAMWYVTHLFDIYMAFCVLAIGITYVWSGISFTSWSQPKRRAYVEKSRAENKTVYESVSNWQTVTYFNRAPYERERYKSAVSTSINAYLSYLLRSYTGHVVQDMIMTFGFTGCCILAISQIVSGHARVGNLVTLMMYWDTMCSPLWMMANSYRHIAATLIDAERLLQLLNTKPSVTDLEHAAELTLKSCKVEFKDVDFAYDERKPVLKNVNFVAESGSTVAFVGETGGGKSTMLKLLNRFYDVTGGSIAVDGQDVRSVTISSLREALGIVPQDPALFNQSILENVRFARLEATDAQIHEACKAAAVHDKIMTFPDGYKSKVGERGVKLSGGELQRVAIARVLLKNPKIVMLDEATSAVDSSTEAQIQEAFKRLSSGRTTFVVAHRLSTIVEANLILVVDHGEIIERGTHSDLLQKGGKYLELWNKQTNVKPSKANSTAERTDDEGLLIDITPPEDEEQVSSMDAIGDNDDIGERRTP